jgi:(R,R)-butanediol dehydrogenase/meso-butanediol dehydrogenase/diacetyl reductase
MPVLTRRSPAPSSAPAPEQTTFYVLTAPGRLEKRSARLGPLQDGWVRLRFHYCGICGSDVSFFHGRRGPVYPLSLGHELVATVEALGNGVEGLAVGTLVTSDLQYRCGACFYCAHGRSHLCEQAQRGLFSNRAFATLGDVHHSYLFPLPGRVPAPAMTLAEPLSCVLHAVEPLDLAAPGRVLIVGAGSIGLCMSFALTAHGVAFEITDRSRERLARIEACLAGASRAVDAPSELYDLVLDASGTPGGLLLACRCLRPGGTLCSMSHLDGLTQEEQFLTLLSRKDATFRMSYLNGERDNVTRAIALLRDRWSGEWDRLLAVHPDSALEAVFANHGDGGANKDVVDCSGITSL